MFDQLKPWLLAAVVLAVAAPGAQASKDHIGLWATVNRCDPSSRPGAVGIRMSIPRLKDDPQQWARIHLQWFDGTARAWRRVTSGGDTGWKRIGKGRRRVEGGTTFMFPPPQAGSRIVLRGVVNVQWRKGTDVVDRERVRTASGHRNPEDPQLRISRSSCEITR